MTETAVQMHCEHSPGEPTGDGHRPCGYCLAPFLPRRPWAKFCSTACRNEANARKIGNGIRGVVSSVRVMKRGSVSVVLRFGLEERERVLKLAPGDIFEGEKA